MTVQLSVPWKILVFFVLLAILLSFSLPVVELAPARAEGSYRLNVSRFTLDNGLNVILVDDHSAPTVAVDVWYRVGSADDPPERSGFAHLFEHMMFQGSANVPPGRFDALMNDSGSFSNAMTELDRTSYFETLPSSQLPLALWLEADRMRSLVVDEANFLPERDVVEEEYRETVSNQPYGQASLLLETIAFDYQPYRRPVIGSIEDLNRATLDEVRAFHAAYYTPNNATLTVAGDIDPTQARGLVERYFGDIPRQAPSPALPAYSFARQDQPREVTLNDPLARVPAAMLAYRLPPRGDPAYYPAVLLARIIGQGDSSRLARALIDPGLAAEADAVVLGNAGPSVLRVNLMPNPGVDPSRLLQVFYQELDRLREGDVEKDELTKAVNQILTEQVQDLQTALGVAESVQAANFYLGDPNAVFTEMDRYRAVTAEDIRQAADLLGQDSRNVVKVQVGKAGPSASSSEAQVSASLQAPAAVVSQTPAPVASASPAALATPPPPLTIRELTLPPVQETALANGLRVIVVPMHELPFLTVRVVLMGGESAAPARLTGLAQCTADLLARGTATRTAQDIAGAVELVGGALETDADDDVLQASISVLSQYKDLAFDMLSDVVLHPSFPNEELATERERLLSDLDASLAEPAEAAGRAFDALLYGAHPYGRLDTEASLGAITRQDVVDFYSRQSRPKNAVLVVAGDIPFAEAIRQAERVFGGWTGGDALDQPAPAQPAQRDGRAIYLLDRPGSSQAEISIGNIALPGSSPLRYAAVVANQVLGGNETSRLWQVLREEKGYTYGIYSRFDFPRLTGALRIEGPVRSEVAEPAVREILSLMQDMRDSLVPVERLAAVKAYLIGGYALRLETSHDLTDLIVRLVVRGLPLTVVRDYPALVDSVDAATVQRVGRDYVRPDGAIIVVAGDARLIKPGLERIAPVRMVDADGQILE